MRLLLLLPFLFASVYAQDTGTLVGRVMDSEYDEGLPGANVYLEGTGLGAATDLDGMYRIDGIPPGIYTVTARLIGYDDEPVVNVQISVGDITHLDFELEDSAITDFCFSGCHYYRPLILRDVYSSRVILGHDPYSAPDMCGCREGHTIDLRSLPVER